MTTFLFEMTSTLQPGALPRRDPMPRRICVGYQRPCSTPLSRYNPDSLCSVCSARRADAIASANEQHAVRTYKSDAHCSRGHVWTPFNSKIGADGYRRCRECDTQARLKAKIRERVSP